MTKPKKVKTSKQHPSATESGEPNRVAQQKCLNIFREALWTSSDDLNVVQEVKTHLFNRDFITAFGRPEYLQAYALRWSPSRALCYGTLFQAVQRYGDLRQEDAATQSHSHVVCIGGGAGAELVGLSAWLNSKSTPHEEHTVLDGHTSMHVHLVDIADWADVSSKLYSSITQPPSLSQYASSAARQSNAAFVAPIELSMQFIQADVLEFSTRDSWLPSISTAGLVTIMFALNELYTSSRAKTQLLLQTLTEHMRANAMLLVVDSPGSYSTISLNGNEKKYPMHWLLDHALLGTPSSDEEVQWTKLMNEESHWFRLPEGLEYPIELENMRYQIHLYRRRLSAKDTCG